MLVKQESHAEQVSGGGTRRRRGEEIYAEGNGVNIIANQPPIQPTTETNKKTLQIIAIQTQGIEETRNPGIHDSRNYEMRVLSYTEKNIHSHFGSTSTV